MNKKLKILNLEPEGFSFKARQILEQFADIYDGPLHRDELIKDIGDFDILIVRLAHKIDTQILDAARSLKIIVTATTGLNHIELEECKKRRIEILSLKDEINFLDEIHATAEHTWALLLSLIRKLPFAFKNVLDNQWDRDQFKGIELHGRTLGIIGFGRLGRKVAKYGFAFGMKVLVYDKKQNLSYPDYVEKVELNYLLSHSDVVTLHIDYERANHKFIDYNKLKRIKKGAVLINTSRGELIDEEDLIEILNKKHLSGAALDVITGENDNWNSSKDLFGYARTNKNLIITPHIGGCTHDSMEKTEIFMAQKLSNFLLSTKNQN